VAVTDKKFFNISLISRKRTASTELSYRVKCVLAPLIYKGLSLRELRDFLLGCDVYFNVIKEHMIYKRIAVIALYIRDNALR
jgi:hypothetical protein